MDHLYPALMPRPPRTPTATQLAIGQALSELALLCSAVEHRAVFDHLAGAFPWIVLYKAMRGKLMRKALPPGCRMTATHFEFS